MNDLKYSNEDLLEMYETMVLGRQYCLGIEKACHQGKIIGMHHLGLGEEAVSAAVIYALTAKDWLVPQSRMQTAFLKGPGKDVDLKKHTAEHFGKVTGYYNGLCCDLHMANVEHHMLMNNCLMGTNYGIATGFAKALKMKGEDQIVVAGLGDGSFNEGIVYESFEIAADQELPVVFVLNDNGWGMSYDSRKYKKPLGSRADAFGIPSAIVDGNDIFACREAMDNAVAKARKNEPNLVQFNLFRWMGHFVGDQQPYRNVPEMMYNREHNDCIKRFEAILFGYKILDEEKKQAIWNKIDADLKEAFDEAIAADFPGKELVLDKTMQYVNPWEDNEQ